MRVLKKIGCFLVVILLMPVMVFADDAYITYSDIVVNEQNCMGGGTYGQTNNIWAYDVPASKGAKYSFNLKGFNLVDDETYTFTLTSDYKNYKKEYTGIELKNGVTITGDDGDSRIDSKLFDKEGKLISVKVHDLFDYVSFRFNETYDSSTIDDYYNSMLTNGKIKLNTINPIGIENFAETAITMALNLKYEKDGFDIYGGCYEKGKPCTIYITDIERNRTKIFEVEFEYEKNNIILQNKLDAYSKKLTIDGNNIEKTLLVMEDLETVNYRYAASKYDTFQKSINAIINYSSEVRKKVGNSNIDIKLDARAGWDDQFSSGGFGFLDLLYDGIIYSYAEISGVKQNNVLYVPDDTADTRDAYIKAALDRVNKYIPKADVKIEYAGQIDDVDDFGILSLEDIVDVNKTLGEYYKVTIGDKIYYYFIAKDSSKMRTPVMNTVDALTDISIKTDVSEVPLDSKINAVVIDANSDEYKEFLKNVNVTNGFVVDLKLFSDSINKNISKLDNGLFKVYIPLNDELRKLDLTAYYVKDNGEIEKHDVKIEGDYLVFETDHFSTYVIGGNLVSNPATLDNISKYVISLIISIGAMVVTSYTIIKKKY